MLVLLFYSIISDGYTFSDKLELTQENVKSVMDENPHITDVYIKNIKKIGTSAFYHCEKIKSVSIGYQAFYRCSKLTKISFEEKSQLTTIERDAFSNCVELGSFSIPSSVDSIGAGAFYGCSKLEIISF